MNLIILLLYLYIYFNKKNFYNFLNNMNKSERKKITEKDNNFIQQSKNTKSNQKSIQTQQSKNQPLQLSNESNSQQVIVLNHPNINQMPYNQPIIITPEGQTAIVMNQVSPKLTVKKFNSVYPKKVTCPYCKQKMKTRVEESFNVFT